MNIYRKRQIKLVGLIIVGLISIYVSNMPAPIGTVAVDSSVLGSNSANLAIEGLGRLQVKGRAPKGGYTRDEFGSGWATKSGCSTRNIILNRDLESPIVDSNCNVISGTLNDPYTGKIIEFKRGSGTSGSVQIDHVVALSDAWQKGAQQLSKNDRVKLANDPLELLAVDGPANMQKSDGDAATWLPSNKQFRCQYVARQIAIKLKYGLWVTKAEYEAMDRILHRCPNQLLPTK